MAYLLTMGGDLNGREWMAKDRILIKPTGWEVFLIHDGKKILVAFAGSEGQAKRYAKEAEMRYGLKKKKKKKVTGAPTLP